MSDDRKSVVQKLFTGMVPATTAADMEAHSRAWMLQCPKCGYERSIWDMGGIRYKATGNSRNFMRCVSCGQRSWHKMYKREGPLSETPPGVTAAPTATAPATTPATATGGLPRWLPWTVSLGMLAILAAIVTVIVLFVLGIVFLVSALTQPIVTVGDGFMAALKTSNDAQAYALCAPDLQKELGSVSGMSALVRDYRPTHWSWSSRSIRNGVGRLDGSFTYSGSKNGSVRITLRQVGNDWRIVSFRMDPN